MASKAVEETTAPVGYDENQFEWETVHEEAPDQLQFTDVGDTYVGEYKGHDLIFPQPDDHSEWFIQLKWRDPAGLKTTNAGYELQSTFTEVKFGENGDPIVTDIIPPGTVTRLRLMKLVDIGQPSLMKSFRVDSAKSRADNKG